MALSGSFNTTAYSGRYLTFSWTATQDTNASSSTISWKLVGAGGGNIYYRAAPFKVVIAGETVYSSSTRINLYSGTTVASGTKTIQHNSDGKKSFSASVEAAIYYSTVNVKGSGSFELDEIPVKASFTSAPDFTDEDNPTIYYTNPSGSKASDVLACITNSTGSTVLVPYRSINKTGTSYTFNLTAAEREALCNASANSASIKVRFYLRTVLNGTNYHSYTTKTLTIANAAPTVVFTVEERNRDVLEVTGNSQILVKGVGIAGYTVLATPKKGATITSYLVSNGGREQIYPNGDFHNIEDGLFSYKVVDSRGYVVSGNKSLTVNDYANPTISLNVATDIAAGTNVLTATLTISGTYYGGTIGDTPNAIAVYYQIKESNGSYGEWIRADGVNINPDTYTYNVMGEIFLDYRKAYTIRARVADLIEERHSNEVAIVTKPVFDWSKSDFNFNVPVSFEGEQMEDFVVATGTASMGTNGTWYWQKWKSGKAECYGLRNYGNMGVSTAFGGLYRSAAFQQSLPSGLFVSAPECCNINYAGSSSDWAAFIMPRLPATASNSCGFYVLRPESGTISQAQISFYILGRWK